MKPACKENSLQSILTGIAVAFMTMMMVLALAGYFIPIEENTHGTFGDQEGVSYATILQIAAFSVCVSLVRLLFMSKLVFKKMLLLWRSVLSLLGATGVMVVFVLLFEWFPLNSWDGWLGYFMGIGIFGGIVVLVLWLKTRRQTKQYDDLLQQYKQNKQ